MIASNPCPDLQNTQGLLSIFDRVLSKLLRAQDFARSV
jgi:hypothetical protein